MKSIPSKSKESEMKGPKKIEIEVEMEGGKGPLGMMGAEAEDAEEGMYDEMAPKGKFTPRGLAPLVKAANALLPLFGQTPDYPALNEPLTQLPNDLVRVLSMVVAAVDDAIAAEAVGPDVAIVLDGVTDDRALMLLAAKMTALAKDREFKRFLNEPGPAPEANVDEERTPMPEMADEAADSLMMSRM